MEGSQDYIVMFPLMAQGHIIPFLALARQIEKRGHKIAFVSTPLNIKRLQSSVPLNSSFRLVEIPYNSSDHGLPSESESTDTLPQHLIPRFIQSTLCLKPPFREIISNLTAQHGFPPLCIIADMFFGWAAHAAQEYGVFTAIFCSGGGLGVACSYSLWQHMPHKCTNADEFLLPDLPEVGAIHVSQLSRGLQEANTDDSWTIFQRDRLPEWLSCDALLFNTIEDLDKIGLAYFRRKTNKPVWPVGPILLPVENRKISEEANITSEICKKWLDTKGAGSVLYVSFGSQNTISAPQMMELATALEASRKYFIWVIRPPLGFEGEVEFEVEKWLPEGFEERMEKWGLIIEKWAPQVEILSHKAVGAFLSHCGWNSVLEALSFGVPLIGWPIGSEQCFNVKLLEEQLGVCLELARGQKYEVRHEDIVERIELIMQKTNEGNEVKINALRAMEKIQNASKNEETVKGSSVKALDEFFCAANLMKQKAKQKEK